MLVVVCSPVRRATSYTAAPSITIPSHPQLAPSSACFRISKTQLFRPRKVPEFRLRLVGLVTTCLSTGCRPTLTSPAAAGQASLLIPAHILAPPMTGQDSKVQGAIKCIRVHMSWRHGVGLMPGSSTLACLGGDSHWGGLTVESLILALQSTDIGTLSAPPICPARNHNGNPIKNQLDT